MFYVEINFYFRKCSDQIENDERTTSKKVFLSKGANRLKTKETSNSVIFNDEELKLEIEKDEEFNEENKNNCISQHISEENDKKSIKEEENKDNEIQEMPKVQELTLIEKFFHDYWSLWMNKGKFIVFGITIIWVAICIWRISLFTTAKDPIQRLPDDNKLRKLDILATNGFHSALDTGKIEVSFIWGIKSIDKSGVGRWDSSNLGKLIYDDTFNLAPVANQQRILDICTDLRNSDLVDNRVVTCWLEDFVNAQGGGSPVPEANFYTQLEAYLLTPQGEKYYNQNLIGYVDKTLLFIQIVALTTEAPFQGRKILYPIFKKWEDLKDSYNSASPKGLDNAFETSGYNWAWLETEAEMLRGVIQGIIISLLFAFFILVLSTLNIVVALYAVLSISVIVLSVIAIMEMNSWGLGVIEAIATVMIIGFSVDYVVHLGNHYVE